MTLRGAEAPPPTERLGPDTLQASIPGISHIVDGIGDSLPTIPSEQVSVSVKWLDGDNDPRSRVNVELDFVHQPIIPGILPWGPLELRVNSTMSIVN